MKGHVVACCIGLAGTIIPASAEAGTLIRITFSDHDALSWVYAQARNTAADFTFQQSDGKLAVDISPTYDYNDQSEWVYSQPISTSSGYYYFDVWPDYFPHFHLDFKDSSFYQSCFGDPGDGYGAGMTRRVNGICQPPPPDYAALPRTLSGHDNTAWITASAQNVSTGEYKFFRFTNIQVLSENAQTAGPAVPLQAWGLTSDGNWYSQDNIAGFDVHGNPIAANVAINFAIYQLWYIEVGPASSYSGLGHLSIGELSAVFD